MYQFLIKNGFKLAVYFATVITCIFLLLAILTGPEINIASGEYSSISQFNFGIIMGILCLLGIIGLSAFFTLKSILANKNKKSTLGKLTIALGGLFIIFAFLLRSSNNAVISEMLSKYHISPVINGILSTGILLGSITAISAFGLIIYLELKNITKG